MKNNRFLIILLSIVIILAAFLLISNIKDEQLIGGDKDEDGCLIGAGYSWCPSKQKCLRVWEEACE